MPLLQTCDISIIMVVGTNTKSIIKYESLRMIQVEKREREEIECAINIISISSFAAKYESLRMIQVEKRERGNKVCH